MSSLKEEVLQGLARDGLSAEEAGGGLLVRGLPGEMPVSLWIDDMERVVKAETPLCYPVDDHSPDLGLALDYLNRCRAGVNFAYRESNRAVVASTAWTSPTRGPSGNQLHLLLALLVMAKERDAPALQRIADGEGFWEEVVDQKDPRRTTTTLRFMESVDGEGPTRAIKKGAMETQRWEALMGVAEGDQDAVGTGKFRRQTGSQGKPPGEAPAGGWRKDSVASEVAAAPAFDDMPTRRLDQLEEPKPAAPGRRPRKGPPPELPEDEPPQRLSRHALQIAVQQAEKATVNVPIKAQRSGGCGRTLFRTAFVLGALGAVGYLVFVAYLRPFYPTLFNDLNSLFKEATQTEEAKELERRQSMAPGADLLLLELQEPLADEQQHNKIVARCLDGLGPRAAEVLESLLSRAPTPQVGKRAFALWTAKSYQRREGAVLRTLRAMGEARRTQLQGDETLALVLGQLGENPPDDASLIEALDWAQGDVWAAIVERLGRPGEGAEARAAALARFIANDPSGKLLALRAMIKAERAPSDAAVLLVERLGVEWANGAEGRPILIDLVRRQASSVDPLLRSEDEAVREAVIDLLLQVATPDAAASLVRVVRSDKSVKLRIKAARGLGGLGSPEMVWPFALELTRTPENDDDKVVQEEVTRQLRKQPEDLTVGQIRPHLQAQDPRERFWAVQALGALETPAALLALVELGLQDSDVRIRRRSLQLLNDQRDRGKATVAKGLSRYRDLARGDEDPTVAQLAGRLYKAITGHDP